MRIPFLITVHLHLVQPWKQVGAIALPLTLLLTACFPNPHTEQPRDLQIEQRWQLDIGDRVAGRRVLGGLGDISVALDGKPVYAPFDGKVQRIVTDCVVFSSPQVPAYLFRLCGLKRPHLGELDQGDVIGRGNVLQFATLRRQPDGRYALVEPSSRVLERTLGQI